MIVLLGCSINLLANDSLISQNPSTGELDNRNDSVLIAYDDLRTVNSKLIELDYERQINTNLRNIISNDSIALCEYDKLSRDLSKENKKHILQRNIALSGLATFIVATIILIFK